MQSELSGSAASSGAFDPFVGGRLVDSAPTTEAQREILAAIRLAADAALAYNEVVHLRFDGPIDADALEEELGALYRRHPGLRITFSSNDEAFFVWDRELDVTRPEVSPDDLDAAVEHAMEAAVTEPLDVREGPLFRAILLQADGRRTHLVLVAHHLVCDGWSYDVLVRELSEGYARRHVGHAAPSAGPEHDFVTYARRAFERETDGSAAGDIEYWKNLFQGSIPILDLPTDWSRPSVRTFRARRGDGVIGADLLPRLRQAASTCETSLFGLLLSAFYVVLGRLSRQSDLVVAVPAAGQPAASMPGVVGHCVNVLPLRMVIDGSEPFPRLTARLTERLSDAFSHQEFTLGRLMRSVHVPRDPSKPAVASVMFNMDRSDPGNLQGFGDAAVTVRGVPRVAEYFEIFLNLFQEPDGVRLECQYAEDLFDEATIVEWMESYVTLLHGVAADPERSVDELPWVPERTLAVLGCGPRVADPGAWQGPRREIGEATSLLGLFQARARKTPHATAVRWLEGELSYEALLARGAGLSHGLAKLGISPGHRVGVYLDRNERVPAGLLGIMGAGAAYVPLDLRDPPRRLEKVVEDAGLAAILTDEANRGAATRLAAGSFPVVTLEELGETGHLAFVRDVARPHEDVAYVIYTSGSTGAPKGVEVSHRNLVNVLLGMADAVAADTDTAILAITALSFDISALEIFLPLLVGGQTLPLGGEQAAHPDDLARAIRELEATTVQATPSTWSMLIDSGWEGQRGLTALVGGETLSPRLADELMPRVDAVWNVYGPTETTIWSTCGRVASGEVPVPIGEPLANTVVHVLDTAGRPVPLGVPGELTIGGHGVARGYLHRPDLTAERFVPDPTGCDGGRFYRTGDLGKWGSDGRLRFLRRLDEQVKIRGHRVELGEIEALLASHPLVGAAAVALREGHGRDEAVLVAWFEARSSDLGVPAGGDFVGELKAHLRGVLPSYMVPEHLLQVHRMPTSSAGKVSKDALPFEPSPLDRQNGPGTVPAGATARFVADTWANVLGLDAVVLEDDFFELGGHSILGIRVVTRIERQFDIRVGFRALFEAPTLEAFIQRVSDACAARDGKDEEWEEWVL